VPTKNIKVDYGAAGDTQLATATVTLSLSTPTQFSITSNLFVSGDIGKSIALTGAVPVVGANPLGTLLSTISAVGAFSGGHQTITMAGSATVAITGTTQSIEWGTDDSGAFATFTAAFQGQSGVILTIPAGRYAFANNPSAVTIGWGLLDLTVNGSGGPTLTDMLGGGGAWSCGGNGLFLFNDNTAQSLVQTVSTGATTLHMVTPSDAGKYTAGTWAWMTGYETQGFGSPPNPAFADFVFITGVDASAGTVNINTPLKHSYESTWPSWMLGSAGTGAPNYTGGQFGLGGPGTLYLIQPNWNASQVWNGVNFSSNDTLFNCTIRSVTFNNCSCENFGPNVSTQQLFAGTNLTVPTLWELDKGTELFQLSNSTIHGMLFQSRGPFNTVLSNVTVSAIFNGTPLHCTMINCTIGTSPFVGPVAYGNAESLVMVGTSFSSSFEFASGVIENDIAGAGGWSCANGLMSRLKSGGTGAPPQWAVPGSYFVIGSRYHEENRVWKCLDVRDDGTTLFLQTDQFTGLPAIVSPATALLAAPVLPTLTTFAGNSGCDDANGLTVGHPFSHWLLTYSGNIGVADPSHLIKAWGNVVSIKITVLPGYSAGTLSFAGFVVFKPQNINSTTWNPTIDLTVTGTRTITPAAVTGLAGADSGLALPNSGNVWLVSNQIEPAMSGAVGAGSVQIEILTDQGFPPDAPRALYRPRTTLVR
jgi:hypothetical protein